MAVISLDFSSVATWPRAIPSSLAQALTMCSGPRPLRRVVGAAAGLAVDGDQPGGAALLGPDGLGDPVPEALLECLGLQRHQQAADAVA